MPARRVLPGQFKAGRTLSLAGVTYARGAAIPAAVVAGTRRSSALLSRRWVIPVPDPQLRRTREHIPVPTAFGVDERGALAEVP